MPALAFSARRLAAALLYAAMAAPAAQAAPCLTADSVDQGITFNRQDKRGGRVIRRDGQILIDYSTREGTWTDERVTLLGIYELTLTLYRSDEQRIGDGDSVVTQEFRRKPPVPEPGGGWNGTIRLHEISYNSSEIGYQEGTGRLQASYAFLSAAEVELSGCRYRVIPVEASFTHKAGGFTRRWLYFPDLGFGLETRQDGTANGLTALTPAR